MIHPFLGRESDELLDGTPLEVSEGGEVEGGLEDGGVAAAALGLVQDEQGEELHTAALSHST